MVINFSEVVGSFERQNFLEKIVKIRFLFHVK